MTIRRRLGAVLSALLLGAVVTLPAAVAAGAAPTPEVSPSIAATPDQVASPRQPASGPPVAEPAATPSALPAEVVAPAEALESPTPTPTAPSSGEQAIAQKAATSVAVIGTATSAVRCDLVGGGCLQSFQDGTIYWTSATGAHYVKGAIRSKWASLGWETGDLGYPTSDEICGLAQGGCRSDFQYGSIAWSPTTGARAVTGPILAKWVETGRESGPLGYPRADEKCGLAQGGCLSDFQNGTIYWTSATGAHYVKGAIRSEWASIGWETGDLGYPTSDEICGLAQGGCRSDFQYGSIAWSPGTGAHYVKGAILAKWVQTGRESGTLGYPRADEKCGLAQGGCLSDFQNGTIYWTSATGAHYVKGAIRSKWASLGWENGFLGYPRADEKCGLAQGGCLTDFQGGTIYWTSATGAHYVKGAIRSYWAASGWENGRYGYPTTDEICRTGAGGSLCRNEFQDGTIKWRSDVGIIDCDRLKCMALTFDDGPSPTTTGQILDTLDANNVQATFFMIGENVRKYPSVAQRAYREGHETMNHSWDHPFLTDLEYDDIYTQLVSTSDQIQATVGQRPNLMRPPHGAYNSAVVEAARRDGLAVILWGIETSDWYHLNPATTIQNATRGAKPDGIVLMHDIHPTTAEAVPGVVSNLKSMGYTLVTVSDMIEDPQAGGIYTTGT